MAYDNETYLQSLATSRADAERQVQNTLSEIARQQTVNTTQARLIPQATGNAFQGAQLDFDSDLGQINRAAGTQLQLPEIGQAMATHQGGFRDAAGLLERGFGEQATQRTGGVNTIAQQLYGDIDRQRAEYIARREGEDRERAAREAEAARQRAFEAEQQRLALEVQARIAAQNRAAMGGGGGGGGYGPPPGPAQLPAFIPGKDATGQFPTGWNTWDAFAKHNPELAAFTLFITGGNQHNAIAEARKNEWITPQIMSAPTGRNAWM